MVFLREVVISTKNLAKQRDFFEKSFGLPVIAASYRLECASRRPYFAIRTGTSVLTFQEAAEGGNYHYAFNIPENQFQQAKQWLGQRTDILGSADDKSKTDFHFDGWNADAVYFRDPEGNVGELIARHTLTETASSAPFTEGSLLCCSEIMLPAEAVVDTAAAIRDAVGGCTCYHYLTQTGFDFLAAIIGDAHSDASDADASVYFYCSCCFLQLCRLQTH